jgi:hypothetical protein
MTPTWIEGFEHGVLSSSGGGIVNSITGSPSVQSSIKRTGSYAVRFNPTAATSRIDKTLSSAYVLVARLYVYVATWPSANTEFLIGSHFYGLQLTSTSGRIRAYMNGGTFNYLDGLTTGEWHRIDLRVDSSGATTYIDFQLDGTAATQSSSVRASAACTALYTGPGQTCTADIYVDDIVVSATSGDYPLGAGGVVGLSPNAAGTSNPGTGVMRDNGSADVNDSTNPANIELDEVPLGSGVDYIKQIGGASTLYAAVAFDDTAETTIHGAMAFEAYQSAAASPSNSASAKIYDEDGVETAIYTGDMTETSTFYKSVIIPAPSGGWDMAAVNALQGRVGYATDYAPVPYWYGLMIQVAVGEGGGVTLTVQDAGHEHSAESPVLTQVHNLTPQDGAHDHVADNVALTQAHVLTPADAAHEHSAENVVLELAGTLVVQDSQHLHAAEEPTLTQAHQLALQDAAHAHGAESPALVQQHTLALADAAHAHAAENVTLDVGLILAVQDASHVHSADNVALVQQHLLAVADALHAALSDVLDLFQQHVLVTQDGIHLLTSDNVTLSELAAGYIAEFIIPVRGRTRIVKVAHRPRIVPVRGRTRIIEVERRI